MTPRRSSRIAIDCPISKPAPTLGELQSRARANRPTLRQQIEALLHWTFDVTFGEDQFRLAKGHGANNMAVVRHFAINLCPPGRRNPAPRTNWAAPKKQQPPAPRQTSIKVQKLASRSITYLAVSYRLTSDNLDSNPWLGPAVLGPHG